VHTSAGKTHEIKYKYIGSRRPRTMVVAGDASTSAYRNVENQLLFRLMVLASLPEKISPSEK
jgi:hypothetical protein